LSGFLLDTNVISMMAPSRSSVSTQFLEWLERMDREGRIFLSVVTVHEIEKGIALLAHRGAVTKAAALKVWLAGLVANFDDKILACDVLAAALAGQLEAKAVTAGHNSGMADATVAGIASAHDLVVVTCNKKHFEPFGVGVSAPDEIAASA
jgi:predicted nucleic acid-binding protein